MVTKEQIKKVLQGFGAGAVGGLLASGGVVLTDTQFSNQLEGLYVCPLFELDVYEFDRLSGSNQRGYPEVGTTRGYTDCKSGNERAEWQTFEEYADEKGFDAYELYVEILKAEKKIQVATVRPVDMICTESGCVEK